MIQALVDFFGNEIFWISMFSWFCAQLIKIAIDYKKNKGFDSSLLTSSGGMPSSHSSFVMAMSVSMGLREGFSSNIFALCAVFSMVVMYDASGVRRAAGKQAKLLNQMVDKLKDHGVSWDEKLKELLGHSPLEVFCGAILGTVVAIILYYF